MREISPPRGRVQRLVRALSGLLVLLGWMSQPSVAAGAEQYYAYTMSAGTLLIQGYEDGTTYTARTLPSGVGTTGTLSKGEVKTLSYAAAQRLSVETSKPALVVYGYDSAFIWGNAFFPSTDGRKYYGNKIYFHTFAISGNYTIDYVVFAPTGAAVTLTQVGGSTGSTYNIAAGKYALLSDLVVAKGYVLESTKPIALMVSAPNGYTNVPPLPATNPQDDCNSDVGSTYYFATSNWNTGSMAVTNVGTTTATFSLLNRSNTGAHSDRGADTRARDPHR